MLPASSAPEGFVNFLNNLNDNDYVIHITTKSSNEHELIKEINQMIDEIYLNFLHVNNLTDLERKNIERTISNLRDLIIKTISSFQEQIVTLTSTMTTLQKKMDILEKNQMELKRINIISEILSPFKKGIFRNMSNAQIPSCYYNVNLLKSLYSLAKNDIDSRDFYIDIFKKNNEFNQELLDLFRNLLYASSVDLNVPYDILLSLLIEKEKRNFHEHSMIVDFLKDSRNTNDSRLTTLLRQQDILEAFELSEILVVEKIYTTYFSNEVHLR
jgi:hypothetical protein